MNLCHLLSALSLISTPLLYGQNVAASSEPDPFTHNEGYNKQPEMIRVQTEFIELSHKDLSRLMMEDKGTTTNATALRMKVQEMVEKGDAHILETQIMTARSGEMATAESISEFIYPTEYNPSETCRQINPEENEIITHTVTPHLPTAFETRNLGSTLEIEPTVSNQDSDFVNLRYVPEFVWHTGNNNWHEFKGVIGDVNRVEMPNMYTLRIDSSLAVVSGQYFLSAVLSPKDDSGRTDPERKVMLFVKCTVLPAVK